MKHLKVSISSALYDETSRFAADIGEPLTEFARLAVHNLRKGRLAPCSTSAELMVATRAARTILSARSMPDDVTPAEIRSALAAAVVHCRAASPPIASTPVEGRDYFLNAPRITSHLLRIASAARR